MDETLCKRVFAQMYEEAEITDLDIPPMKMPKTLKSLICVGYSATGRGSSNGDDSYSSNNSTEWAHIFAEDGTLRFDNILPALPPVESELHEHHWNLYADTLECAVLAVQYYNATNEGGEYELVAPVLSNIMHNWEHFFIHHVNFIARNKKDSPPELFYAEVVPSAFLKTPDQNPVVRCTVLEPQLCASSPGDVVVASPVPLIHHPPGVDCVPCTYNVYQDSDTD